MGWMHDTLEYFQKEGIYRKHHQNDITFSMTYAFSENFMLPLSHDEVVYGKKSIKGRMTGDEWQQYANLRLLYGYMFTHPGTNLLFMGSEFGQSEEWNFQGSLDWHLLQYDFHNGVKNYITDLNTFYKSMPALYEKQFSSEGFEWIDHSDAENSVLSYIRKGHDEENDLVVICNMTPVIREGYKVGLPRKGSLVEIFNSDSKKYEGSGVSNKKAIKIKKSTWHNKLYSATINLPPLGVIVLKWGS
ncbi:alpha amylase C-terminal domain-containing protein, partial [Aurantibacter sp.]|uniref:alpha amylase C-terminal domain-containing protein n=1 Tax=Aurantibacter sp. TaxID=2807103 RepID=UPI003265119E